MIKWIKVFILFLLAMLFVNCEKGIEKKKDHKNIPEFDISKIELLGELSEKSSEISGLCWFNDKLLILPQYPQRFGSDHGKIFFIDKSELKKYIEGEQRTPINPSYYKIDLSKISRYFHSGSGFESISMIDTTAYFTVEYISQNKTETLLIKGVIDSTASEIFVDESTITTEPADIYIFNMSCESIVTYNDQIYPIFEAFGKNVNTAPKVSIFDRNLRFLRKIDFPSVEYRITDVTNSDDSGRFWAINYFYPGDKMKLSPESDNLIEMYGIGKTNNQYDPIERLLQFQIFDNQILLTQEKPIYIELSNNEGRNWEGIVKYDSTGFIIATDRFPETILAYLPISAH